jgi:hypothetical protein
VTGGSIDQESISSKVKDERAYGLTVSNETLAARIVFSAVVTADLTLAVTGFLKVYGDSDGATLVKTYTINDMAYLNAALALLGAPHWDHVLH